jgi:hypothetical protein
VRYLYGWQSGVNFTCQRRVDLNVPISRSCSP